MFTQTDVAAQVQGCNVPTLVVVGAHDAPAHQVDVFEATIMKWFTHARMVVCADAGHYPMVESPAWLVKEIEGFLRG
jgi:pimeloyl-ACP methyl ester carboxylesterase